MEYREIVSVTGIGGLYQLLSTKNDGAIVRNLSDNTTKFISARLHNVTPLESIEIYTTGENVRLHEILQQMKDSKTAMPDVKKASPADIKTYFKEVYPQLDEDRVYASDMKKMLKWYELLKVNSLLDFSSLQAKEEGAATVPETTEAATDTNTAKTATAAPVAEEATEPAEKPAKKATAKKAAAKKATADTDTAEGEEKPAKKAAAKKKAAADTDTAEGEEKPAKKAAAKKKKED